MKTLTKITLCVFALLLLGLGLRRAPDEKPESEPPVESFLQTMAIQAQEERMQRDKERAEKDRFLSSLQIVGFAWNRGGFGSTMTASFSIRNNGFEDVKDIEIECFHAGASGTVIDSNRRTIYEIVRSGETRKFEGFEMGFINSQAKSSYPAIVGASLTR